MFFFLSVDHNKGSCSFPALRVARGHLYFSVSFLLLYPYWPFCSTVHLAEKGYLSLGNINIYFPFSKRKRTGRQPIFSPEPFLQTSKTDHLIGFSVHTCPMLMVPGAGEGLKAGRGGQTCLLVWAQR